MTMRTKHAICLMPLLLMGLSNCSSDDDGGTEAQRHGVGAACASDADCSEAGQHCLPFKGGYCGVQDCTSDASCPAGSACVTHTDGKNYCFLLCTDKASDCNASRPAEAEDNCSSNVTFLSHPKGDKACVPPT